MKGFQTAFVIIALTGMATTLVLPGRKTADVAKAFGNIVTGSLKVSQGRG